MICMGYAGLEAYDLVLYIGRTLTKLNHRVLIVDLSSSDAMKNSIKHGMGLDSFTDIINYRDINYVRRIPTEEELMNFCDGVMLVSYGYNLNDECPLVCQYMNVVVNTFPHIVNEIDQLIHKAPRITNNIKLLVRDIISLDDVDRVIKEIKIPVKKENTNYLYLELDNYENAVECQVNQVVKFTKITSRVETYIQMQIRDLFPKLAVGKIKKAISAAKKGV